MICSSGKLRKGRCAVGEDGWYRKRKEWRLIGLGSCGLRGGVKAMEERVTEERGKG